MAYDNLARTGIRSSTSPSPKSLVEDIRDEIRVLSPYNTPILSFFNTIGAGAPPKSHKIQTVQYHKYRHYDYCESVSFGADIDPSLARFARMVIPQIWRPTTKGIMIYQPQDRFYIIETGQVVEVVMTPTDSLRLTEADTPVLTLDTELTGGTPTTTAEGSVIVRAVGDGAIIPFDRSDFGLLGRTIIESQKMQATPLQFDKLYDCNFLEHKERQVSITEDMYEFVQVRGNVKDFVFQQKETAELIKTDVEMCLLWGKRDVDMRVPSKPARSMNGLFNAIQTNVAYYNPQNVVDFEMVMINFIHEQAFKYCPNGYDKICWAGAGVMKNFNMTFREHRRTNSLVNQGKVVLNYDEYQFGSKRLKLIEHPLLEQGTPLENWMFVIDPKEAQYIVQKDFISDFWGGRPMGMRDKMWTIEWQGTVAWHLEHSMALLRT